MAQPLRAPDGVGTIDFLLKTLVLVTLVVMPAMEPLGMSKGFELFLQNFPTIVSEKFQKWV